MAISAGELRQAVVGAIAGAAKVPADDVPDDADLLALGLDSLDVATILIDIEDAIGAEVPAEVLDRLLDVGNAVTVGDILRLLSTWDPNQHGTAPSPYGGVIVVQEP